MLTKRIIPCLDIKNGRTVKGMRFEGLRDAGDPIELATRYAQEGADEIVFLDITASQEDRATLPELVKEISKMINIPFTVGGGVRSVNDAYNLLDAGADKISVNSSVLKSPELIYILAKKFGSQFVVVAVDTKNVNGLNIVHSHGGKFITDKFTEKWVCEAENLGAGEILLTSMDRDGTGLGFDLEMISALQKKLTIPLIASGGAGNLSDFADVFRIAGADAALAAGVFHRREVTIAQLKKHLANSNIPVRL